MSRRFALRFSGGESSAAAANAKAFLASLRKEDGSWRRVVVTAPTGGEIQLFAAADDSLASVARRRATKAAGRALLAIGAPQSVSIQPRDGLVASGWTPLAEVRYNAAMARAAVTWAFGRDRGAGSRPPGGPERLRRGRRAPPLSASVVRVARTPRWLRAPQAAPPPRPSRRPAAPLPSSPPPYAASTWNTLALNATDLIRSKARHDRLQRLALHYDVIALQECHGTTDAIAASLEDQRLTHDIWASGCEKAIEGGVALLVRRSVVSEATHVDMSHIIAGRIRRLHIDFTDRQFIILYSVHNFGVSSTQLHDLRKLFARDAADVADTGSGRAILIAAGDWNFIQAA